MQLVERAFFAPHTDIFGSAEGPFIDTGVDLIHNLPTEPRIYIKPGWVQTCATKLFGMVEREQYDALVHERDQLKEQLKEADKLIEASDFIENRRARRAKKE